MEEFVACFAEVVDPRQDNARHNLHELLLIALCTILTGGKDCSDMALFGTVNSRAARGSPAAAKEALRAPILGDVRRTAVCGLRPPRLPRCLRLFVPRA